MRIGGTEACDRPTAGVDTDRQKEESALNTIMPFPEFLLNRHREWKAKGFTKNKARYETLAEHGQHPCAMVISCCDSRVHATTLFGAEPGEFFVHRNIAALVPPDDPHIGRLGTPAAVEYAVKALGVAHIFVLGHSDCGGIRGGIELFSDPDSSMQLEFRFVGSWLNLLRPAFNRVAMMPGAGDLQTLLERESVILSMENLMTFPFVRRAVEAGDLTVHGLWHDIRTGSSWAYDRVDGGFREL